ncbi:MAG TPA: polysaccharide deacetylase family protein [Candidatus Xenobia bacterium]|jgi:peptidoglycan/xylan/chitin deacetylase (PgdA/CDA1 family)
MSGSSATDRVTIIVAVPEGADGVEACLQSCLQQTSGNVEIVVVRPPRDDDLPIDDRIILEETEAPLDLAAALQRGMARASGSFVTWLSPPDFYCNTALERLLQVFKEDPRLSVVYADEVKVDADQHIVARQKNKSPEHLAQGNPIGSCFLLRRSAWDGVGGLSATEPLAVAYEFWLRASQQHLLMRHLPEPLFYARLGDEAGRLEAENRVRQKHMPGPAALPPQCVAFNVGRPPKASRLRGVRDAWRASHYALVSWWYWQRTPAQAAILLYHSVADTSHPLCVRPEHFRAQLEFLQAHYRVIPLADMVARLSGGVPLQERVASLTFDDGYEDAHSIVLPMLQQFNMPATFYLPTSWMGAGQAPSACGALPLMTWEQVRELAQHGFDIGGHTVNHLSLKDIPPSAARREIQEGRARLEEQLGCSVSSFAYPNGSYDQRIRDIVEEAGFTSAVTVEEGLVSPGDDPFTLKRLGVGRFITHAHFRAKLSKAMDSYRFLSGSP